MDDFIFGTLSSDEQRVAHVRKIRAGITHNKLRTPRKPLPGQPVQVKLTVGPAHPSDRAWVYWSTDGQDPGGRSGKPAHGQVTEMELAGVRWDNLEWGYLKHYRAVLPGQPEGTVVRYCLVSEAVDGAETQSDNGEYFAYYVSDIAAADWVYDAVVYQIFVDRFFPGGESAWNKPESPSGFYGGTLKGITEKLSYLSRLGINTIWLSPVFPSPSHHGYDATDFFDIEPRLGTKSDFRNLLDRAHALGLRVLMDFVPNHWSSSHPSFQAALSDKRSDHVAWYSFKKWPDQYETFFGVKDLPKINLRHPQARNHVLESVRYWLDFGVDGFRLDYAIGPARDFWADFCKVTRETKPDSWTFGEVVEPSDSQLSFYGLLDGCLDFILLEAMRQTFAYRKWDARKFTDFLDRHEAHFPGDFSRPSFLDNHDMNRFLWVTRGDMQRLKIAALCQFTLAGPPVIYYGTEVGLSQNRDVRQGGKGILEESRLPMLWDGEQDDDLLAYYSELIQLRKAHRCLRRGSRKTVAAGRDIIAYQRQDGECCLLILINLSDERRTFEVPGNWNRVLFKTDQVCESRNLNELTRVTLDGLSGMVLANLPA